MGANPVPASARSTRWRGTHAWTIAEIANPSTSAHHTSYAIRKAFHSPSPTVERNPPTLNTVGGYWQDCQAVVRRQGFAARDRNKASWRRERTSAARRR